MVRELRFSSDGTTPELGRWPFIEEALSAAKVGALTTFYPSQGSLQLKGAGREWLPGALGTHG